MAPTLPHRRPTAIPPARGGTPSRGSIVAVAVTAAILAAFAGGVLVGRSQGTAPLPTTVVEPKARSTVPESAPDSAPEPVAQGKTGPDIEMIRPDGTVAPAPDSVPDNAAIEGAATTQGDGGMEVAAPAPAAVAPKPSAQPVPSPAAEAPASQPRGIYTVQVAAFRDRESAERTALELESRGYDAYVQRANVDDKGVWYRVRVGAFEDKAAAKRVAEQLEAREGRSAYVTIR